MPALLTRTTSERTSSLRDLSTLGRLGGLTPTEADRGERALWLSGPGYRAALFHLGALTRLNELGLLTQVNTVGAVSGGSISGTRPSCTARDAPGAARFQPRDCIRARSRPRLRSERAGRRAWRWSTTTSTHPRQGSARRRGSSPHPSTSAEKSGPFAPSRSRSGEAPWRSSCRPIEIGAGCGSVPPQPWEFPGNARQPRSQQRRKGAGGLVVARCTGIATTPGSQSAPRSPAVGRGRTPKTRRNGRSRIGQRKTTGDGARFLPRA